MSLVRLILASVLLNILLIREVHCEKPNIGKIDQEAVTASSNEEAVRGWLELENRMIHSVNMMADWIRTRLSEAVSTDLHVSDDCYTSLISTLIGIKNYKLWALKMIDATGKFSGGQLEGTPGAYGEYDECLNIEARDSSDGDLEFTGNYCLVTMRPILPPRPADNNYEGFKFDAFKNVTFKTDFVRAMSKNYKIMYDFAATLALCVPSTCTDQDVNSVLRSVLGKENIHGKVFTCEAKVPVVLETDQYVIFGLCGVIFLLLIVSTLVDLLLQWTSKEKENRGRGFPMKALLAFSLPRTFKTVFAPNKINDRLTFFQGFRFFSMCWVLLTHSHVFIIPHLVRNIPRGIDKIYGSFANQVVVNGFLDVDSFFFLTATLLSYGLVKFADEKGTKKLNYPILFLRRLWRIYPMAWVTVCISLVGPLLSSGPLWNVTTAISRDNCVKYWWTTLPMIGNLFPVFDICSGHLWYIAADTQYFIFGLVYIILIYKSEILARFYLFAALAGSLISTSLILYLNNAEYPATSIKALGHSSSYKLEHLSRAYTYPYVHIGVYAIGLALGTWMARTPKIHLSKPTQALGWLLATTGCLISLYGTYAWNRTDTDVIPSKLTTAIFCSVHKVVWALGLAWMTTMCYYGKGGYVNSILSFGQFEFLNRVSYLMYCLHPFVIFLNVGSSRGLEDFSYYKATLEFLGYLMASFLLALIVKVCLEAPLLQLDKIVFEAADKKAREGGPDKREKSAKKSVGVEGGVINDAFDSREIRRVNLNECTANTKL